MKTHAFAALMALPLLALAAPAAKADRYCCGSGYQSEFVTRDFYVTKHATVFGCDGYYCQTAVILKSDRHVKARCRNGWCQLRSTPFKNAWVLESCLKDLHHHKTHGYPHSKSYEPEYEPAPEPEPEAENEPESYDEKPGYGYKPAYSRKRYDRYSY